MIASKAPRRRVPAGLVLMVLACVAPLSALPAAENDVPCIAVSIPPQAWIADRIAGPMPLEIRVVVPPGSSPATFDPGARQLAHLGSCDALISAGVPFEAALFPRLALSFPRLRVVDGLEGIELLDFEGHEHPEGGAGHEDCAGGKDPHFWLDPTLAARHAKVIARELARMAPRHAAGIESRFRALEGELSALDGELRNALAPFEGRGVAVYHPSFGYFLRRYGLRQLAIESEGRDPGARRLAEIVRSLRSDEVRLVVVQPEFASATAARVAAAVGSPTVMLDPLSRDYPAALREMARRIAEAYGEAR